MFREQAIIIGKELVRSKLLGRNLSGGFFLEKVFEPLYTFDTQNGKSAVLKKFGKSKQHDPKHAFRFCRNGESHLRKWQYVKGDAE